MIGAGAAGLFCALTAAAAGARVTLVSRTPLDGSASYWAQGGLAGADRAGLFEYLAWRTRHGWSPRSNGCTPPSTTSAWPPPSPARLPT